MTTLDHPHAPDVQQRETGPSALAEEAAQKLRARNKRHLHNLFRAYRETRDKQIRDEIFSECLPLVEFLARKYKGRGVDYDDLYQEGCLGLLAAIDRFDPSLGYELSTYAPYFIEGHIKQYFRNKSWPCSVPRSIKTIALRIHKLSQELGREPTVEEIMSAGHVPADKAKDAITATRAWEPVCLYGGDLTGELNPRVFRWVSGPDKDLERVVDRIAIESMTKAVLDSNEKKVIELYYSENMSQKEIARKLGTYQMMVSRTLKKGTHKLKKAFEASLREAS